jgi:hypothetical protein
MRLAVLPLLLGVAACGTAASPQTDPEEPVTTVVASSAPEGPPAKIEGHLAHAVCLGPVLAADPPHKATCCYPAMELIKRPIRGAFPALRACYEARSNKAAEGRVVFAFRIEQDGSVKRVCASEGSTMDDEPALACMVDVIHKVRWEGMSKESRDFCGLISLNYPVVFEP